MTAVLRAMLALALGLGSAAARAEFGARSPSINGTGEVLPAGAGEAGVASIAYGLGDNWMVRVPSALLLVGYGRVEVRRKLNVSDSTIVSPYVDAETPRHVAAGADWRVAFGGATRQTFTAGARLRYGPYARPGDGEPPRLKPRGVFLPNLEYDCYLGGNLIYTGIQDYMPYAGYTWAFNAIHVGLIVAPTGGLVPLPYIYWRF